MLSVSIGLSYWKLISPDSFIQATCNYDTTGRRMIVCWTSTEHRMKGSTVEHAVVYLVRKLFNARQVSLSIKSLDDLLIAEVDSSNLTA